MTCQDCAVDNENQGGGIALCPKHAAADDLVRQRDEAREHREILWRAAVSTLTPYGITVAGARLLLNDAIRADMAVPRS